MFFNHDKGIISSEDRIRLKINLKKNEIFENSDFHNRKHVFLLSLAKCLF